MAASTQVSGKRPSRGTRRLRRRLAGIALLSLPIPPLVVLAGGAADAQSTTRTIASSGPLDEIILSDELNCQVGHVDDSDFEFFDPTNPIGACTTQVHADGVTYGPSSIPAGNDPTPFTAVSQSEVAGSGTASDPFQVTTVVDAGGTGLRITETDSYVVGRDSYRTDVAITNTGPDPKPVIVYRAGDCYLQNSDEGFGSFDAATGAVSCVEAVEDTSGTVPGDRIEQWLPLTAGSHFYHAIYSEVWDRIDAGLPFDDTCRCEEYIDNGGGLSWDLTVPSGGSRSVSHLTTFSPVGTQPLTMTKTAASPTSSPGGDNAYTITITNPNDFAVDLASVTDHLPAGFGYRQGTTTGATTADPSISGQDLTWARAITVPAGGEAKITFGVTVASTPGEYTNRADADAGNVTVAPTGDTAPITVVASNQPPTAADDQYSVETGSEANVLTVLANDFDPDGGPLTITAWDPNGTAGGEVDCSSGTDCGYTPAAGFAGTDTFTYTIEDSDGLTDAATVTVTVQNQPPVAEDDRFAVFPNSEDNVLEVLANDTTPSNDPIEITASNTTGTAGGAVDCSSGTDCRYTPPQAFLGTDTFMYTISDEGGNSDSATVTVDVADCPPVAQAVDDSGAIAGEEWVECSSPTANGASGPLTPHFPPTNGSFALLTSGDVSVAPGPNDESGAGVDNGHAARGAFDVSILRLDLNVPSDADCISFRVMFASEEYPEFVGSAFNDGFIAELDNSTWSVSGQDISAPDNFAFDPNGDVISINSPFFSSENVITDTGMEYDGATPMLVARTPASPGPHQVFLSIFDASDHILDSAALIDHLIVGQATEGGCDPGANIASPNRAPNAVDDQYTVPRGSGPTTLSVLANDSDPDGDPVTITGWNPQGTSGGTVDCSTGTSCTYTPPAGFDGTDTFAYAIADPDGLTDAAVVTITPEPVGPIGIALAQTGNGGPSGGTQPGPGATVAGLVVRRPRGEATVAEALPTVAPARPPVVVATAVRALSLERPSAVPGGEVRLTGRCQPGELVALRLDGAAIGQAVAGADGQFDTDLALPVTDVGRHLVEAQCSEGVLRASLDVVIPTLTTGASGTVAAGAAFLLFVMYLLVLTPGRGAMPVRRQRERQNHEDVGGMG